MLSISRPLSAAHVSTYYQEEYGNSANSYYTEGQKVHGRWHGKLAAEIGLTGAVEETAFNRLALGQNPDNGEQWIRFRDTYRTQEGKEVAHRSAWDLTFSAPKSVSLTALVGEDGRVREAHRRSVEVTLTKLEEYVQARMGGDRTPQTTGKWIAAQFEHDTSRPVNGYPAPQLHTHVVVFNMTEGADGQARSLQSSELFTVQKMATAIYQAELSRNLKGLGYELWRGEGHAPEIKGYTKEYLEAESLRRAEIRKGLEALGMDGARAAQIVALQSREDKLRLTPDELKKLHLANAELYGNQAQKIVQQAMERDIRREPEQRVSAEDAVTFAIKKLSEREAVFDHHQVVREALWYGQGSLRVEVVEKEIEARRSIMPEMAQAKSQPDLIQVYHYREHAPGARYTTPEMLGLEHIAVHAVRGWAKDTTTPIAPGLTKEEIRSAKTADGFDLNDAQKWAVWLVATSRNQVIGLQGAAGAGKSTAMNLLKKVAEQNDYEVIGLAPTSGATKELAHAGINSRTLQRQLLEQIEPGTPKRLYILDESSLAGTKQKAKLLSQIRPEDRLLLVGDTRQHQSIEAGRSFEQMQQAGMDTPKLNKIIRQQQNPELLRIVNRLAAGNVEDSLRMMAEQERLHEVSHRRKRYEAMAKEYAAAPDKTLIVSPDNKSREAINEAARIELRSAGILGEDAYTLKILAGRQDLTTQDLRRATSYEVGNMIRFGRSNEALAVAKGDYALVIDRDTEANTVTVKHSGRILTIEPVSSHRLYKTEERSFAAGERIQITAPWKEKGLSNRDIATLESIDNRGNVEARMEKTGRRVTWNLEEMPHIDYGYAMTSYSAQGQTVDRVLIQIDTGDSRVSALNDKTLLYVAGTRGRNDLQIYTDSVQDLGKALARVNLKPKAMSREQIAEYRQEMPSAAIREREMAATA